MHACSYAFEPGVSTGRKYPRPGAPDDPMPGPARPDRAYIISKPGPAQPDRA